MPTTVNDPKILDLSSSEKRGQEERKDICADHEYFRLIRDVLDKGKFKPDRTGTGTYSLFGAQMRFDLRDGLIPLLTTKKVFWRGVVEELLWFISGSTDSQVLSNKGVHIWDANGSRDFLDKLGFIEREVGDLGPVYGFQWRHWGASYDEKDTNYECCGLDQLSQIIRDLKSDPHSRRHILTAWNPDQLEDMVLPPCHCFAQFYVNDGELSCQLYQRSADVGLGVPFNMASYGLLTHLIAHVTNLKPGEFIHTLGDAHIYSNHTEALQEQLKRSPTSAPKIQFKRKVEDIDDFKAEDVELLDYNPLDAIKMKMSA